MSDLIERVEDRLADFTRDKRIIVLSWMALVVGALSAFIADSLLAWHGLRREGPLPHMSTGK